MGSYSLGSYGHYSVYSVNMAERVQCVARDLDQTNAFQEPLAAFALDKEYTWCFSLPSIPVQQQSSTNVAMPLF